MSMLSVFAAGLITPNEIGYKGPTQSGNLMGGVLNTIYFWLGVVAVGFIIYAAYMYVLSNGDSGKVKKAKDTLLYAVIGIVVVLLAFSITSIVINGVG